MHATSGGVGRTHAGTTDVDRRRRRRRRDNPIADVAGERRHDNLTAAVGLLSGAGRTVLMDIRTTNTTKGSVHSMKYRVTLK